MKKSELKNGDIVICRCGAKGVIIKNENCEYSVEYFMQSNDGKIIVLKFI